MSFELDHVFVTASYGAPEVTSLVNAGFSEGPPNTHPGQGTACRRFFFENAYLELVWLEDVAEASSGVGARTGLRRRAAPGSGASHIGICLRARKPGVSLPVETWAYSPPYLPEGMSIPMGHNSSRLEEPLLFFLPEEASPRRPEEAHPNGSRAMASVRITIPHGREASAELAWLIESNIVRIERAETESLAIEFDGGKGGNSVEIATAVPLRLSW